MTEYKLPDEFWKCGEMYIDLLRERDVLVKLLNNIRHELNLSEGESVLEAVQQLVNNRSDFVREKIVEPKPTSYVYARSDRNQICMELDKLGIPYRRKSSTKDLESKLDHAKTRSSKPPVRPSKQLHNYEW